MHSLSVCIIWILVLVLALGTAALGQESSWPVKGDIDLSSTFCDFRVGHFHGGVDIRTGGAEGREVYSPVDGFIWRIRYSYSGYGKSLYLKDSLGNIYVFGHLSRLADRFEKVVKTEQYRTKRYAIDQYYGHDSLVVKRGELVAFSGQTGAGPPHLHFEKRTSANLPLNPLTNGYKLPDKIPPVIEVIGFNYVDNTSLFPNGERSFSAKARYNKEERIYEIDSAILLSGPFGLEIKTFDRLRPDGPKLNVFQTKLFIDDYFTYENKFDRYDYDQTNMVDLLFNYRLAVESKEYRHLLYNPPGKDFSGSDSPYKDGGIFTFVNENSYGLHNVRIEVLDAYGNKSEILFKFAFTPEGQLFQPEWVNDTTFYLISRPNVQLLDVKEILVFSNGSGAAWRKLKSDHIEKKGRADFKVTLPPESSRWRTMKVQVIGSSGWHRDDFYMVLHTQTNSKYDLDYTLIDGGLLIDMAVLGSVLPTPTIAIVYEDDYVENITPIQIDTRHFAAFYRNHSIFSAIARLEIHSGTETVFGESVDIRLAGYSDRKTTMTWSDKLTLEFHKSNFYAPIFLTDDETSGWFQNMKDIMSSVHKIEPSTFPLASPIRILMKYTDTLNVRKVGISRLNNSSGWTWLASQYDSGWISANSSVLGTFALLKDTEPPRISGIIPGEGKTVSSSLPNIRFSLSDNLSGIGGDQDLVITLDDDWLIPEYDPELSIVRTLPAKKLTSGKHTIEIQAADVVGNKRTVKTSFYVK